MTTGVGGYPTGSVDRRVDFSPHRCPGLQAASTAYAAPEFETPGHLCGLKSTRLKYCLCGGARSGRLRASLPSPGGDIEAQARYVLSLVLDPAAVGIPEEMSPGLARICGVVVESTGSPCCGEVPGDGRFCAAGSGGIEVGSGSISRTSRWRLGRCCGMSLVAGDRCGGRFSPKRAREKAIQREGRKCQVCRGPATTVDQHRHSGFRDRPDQPPRGV